jgi:hypothetical protein
MDLRTQRLEQRLLAGRTIDASTGCWLWTGYTNNQGYGTIQFEGRKQLVHRLAAMLWLQIQGWALHKCDRPTCFNPEHLFDGNNSENQKDSVVKKRHRQSRKTTCPMGHPLAGENLGVSKVARVCKTCKKLQARARRRQANVRNASNNFGG